MGVNGKFVRPSVFIGGGGCFLRLHGRVKVAVNLFSPLEMVAMEYFWVHLPPINWT